MLGVSERFDLDVRSLSASHRRLQFLLHPDKFAQRAPQEQHFAAEHSSFLNKGVPTECSADRSESKTYACTSGLCLLVAYSVLSQPLSRAEYLLGLKARPPAQDCGAAADPSATRRASETPPESPREDEVLDDPELLAEVLELNEALDAVRSDGRSAEQTLRQLRTRFEREAAAIVEQLAAHFAGGNLSSVRAALTRLKFFENLLQRAKVVQRDQIDASFSKR